MTARARWTKTETRDMLEAIIEMKTEGFQPNDSPAWFLENNQVILKQKLAAKKVNIVWYNDIHKVRKKYANIKAEYQKYLKLDKYNTGKEVVDGHENGFVYGQQMHQLVEDSNPVSSPIIVVDGGSISEQVPPPLHAISNPLKRPESKSSMKQIRLSVYKGLATHLNRLDNSDKELTAFQKEDLALRREQSHLGYMQFCSGKSEEYIGRLSHAAETAARLGLVSLLNEYSEVEWISDFRMNKATYSYIKQTVEECWTGYIGVDQALICFIYAIATGECFRSLASRFGISKTSVASIIDNIARSIIEKLSFQISFNLSPEELAIQRYLFRTT